MSAVAPPRQGSVSLPRSARRDVLKGDDLRPFKTSICEEGQ
jgi:hypothetical protein